jgi:phage terminase large subunit GpA-like protein
MIATATTRTTLSELNWFLQSSRAPKLRTMRQFAEQEIVIPDGPFKNQRFNCTRQPYAGVYFDLVDTLLWNRIAATGPSQTGKSLTCLVIPTLYHLFETKENVIFGVPTMDMAGDKWRQDLLPAIEASRYRDLLPTSGAGSKGGTVEAIQFKHGPTLRIMSGGGNDKKRAGYTARVLAITEVDGMDEPGAASREADKITQMEARTLSYGERKRVYLECTISIKEGRINQEVTRGTATRLFLPCPKCGEMVHPTREALNGWQDAADEMEAKANAAVFCPSCGEAWSEAERHAANRLAVPVHRGQEIDRRGVITGDLPQTNTLGFRWDSINNMLLTMGYVGAQEWKAKRAENEANAEKELRQFFWGLAARTRRARYDPARLGRDHGSHAQGSQAGRGSCRHGADHGRGRRRQVANPLDGDRVAHGRARARARLRPARRTLARTWRGTGDSHGPPRTSRRHLPRRLEVRQQDADREHALVRLRLHDGRCLRLL